MGEGTWESTVPITGHLDLPSEGFRGHLPRPLYLTETSLPKGHPGQGVVSSERLSATGAFLELKVRPVACGDNPRDRSEEEASARKGLGG